MGDTHALPVMQWLQGRRATLFIPGGDATKRGGLRRLLQFTEARVFKGVVLLAFAEPDP